MPVVLFSRRLASSRSTHATPSLAARLAAGVGVGALMMALVHSTALAPSAEAAGRSLTVKDGRSTSAPVMGTLGSDSARASFAVPRKRPSTLTLALDLRRQRDGDRYRARAQITRGGVVTVSIVRHRDGRATVLSSRRLAQKVKKGQTLWLEGTVRGSSAVAVGVRAWRKGRPAPAWQASAVDRSGQRVAAAGRAGAVVGLAQAAGRKKVKVRYSAAKLTPVAVKPSADTTGVPAGTALRTHHGDIVVTKAGTRLDRLDIHGFVVVRAPNVTISRSIVRGGKNPRTAQGVITNYGSKNLVITDTDIRIAHPSVYLDGIKGWSFTARRVHVVGGVDSIKIHGNDVTVTQSLLENTTWYAHDPYQNGGPTHNDNIQILKGRNLTITGNTIRGAQNFAVLGAANIDHVPNLVVAGNWLDGGHCTLKLQTMRGHRLTASVTDNRFGPNRRVSYCPIQALPEVDLTARNNVSELTGRPVQIYRKP